MLGDGKGGFIPKPSIKSGFFARNDAKKIKMINNNIVLVANNNGALQSIKVNE